MYLTETPDTATGTDTPEDVPVILQTPETKPLLRIREPDVPPHLAEQSRQQYEALMAYAASMDPEDWYTSHGHGD
ncbi:hypothetical protein COU78_06030 [Candidatus Peregrinibacteria bacterium CG10_big_fil_rev_8_21_14_0_10_49_24]|nr:MAG: hypothetical protein COV83_02865 [Candidatus Peregrinibacteria bacterium CG11_big_fil_rev_8_21_14_0_20_49_14]PIR50414.1 MAG: hypothetical protein COU78_06030 [Candidatus Peregrinibacteria bacterium CG10_big_fil_rev_8_21_14_0_10_49_24]PJA68250.1 MAG: hypothetical protein CO157_00020 [Candidatus Peregrinibacteria bacterium CG_4_9_14_3_um_filter_49_12]